MPRPCSQSRLRRRGWCFRHEAVWGVGLCSACAGRVAPGQTSLSSPSLWVPSVKQDRCLCHPHHPAWVAVPSWHW